MRRRTISDLPISNPSTLQAVILVRWVTLVSLSMFAPCFLIKLCATSTLPQITAIIKGLTPLPRLPDTRLFSSSVALENRKSSRNLPTESPESSRCTALVRLPLGILTSLDFGVPQVMEEEVDLSLKEPPNKPPMAPLTRFAGIGRDIGSCSSAPSRSVTEVYALASSGTGSPCMKWAQSAHQTRYSSSISSFWWRRRSVLDAPLHL